MTTDPQCFVIMPINNPATEFLYSEVYYPIITAANFMPDRIDKTEDGGDLAPKIMEKIVTSSLIIADITMERQNCYFELGFAYGRLKSQQIIVCCREDHYARSPNYRNDGPCVHFDMGGKNYFVVASR